MINSRTPLIVKEAKRNEWLNVFLIASPTIAIIVRMIIDKYKLENNNILLVSIRSTNLDIFENTKIDLIQKKYDGYLEKIFFLSPKGIRIQNHIKKNNKKFLVYASWAYREVNWLLKSNSCVGHIYIDEGQGTYMNYIPFSYKKQNLFEKFLKNWKNRINVGDGSGDFYRDDAHAHIGMFENCYPKIIENKYILDDFENLKKYYKPKLLGVKTIGLTCSASRLSFNQWGNMLKILAMEMGNKGIIKPHPSFTTSEIVYSKFKNVFKNVMGDKIKLCPPNVFIELEMLYENKKLIGPQSSLKRFSDHFKSEYKQVNLYNKL